MIGTPQRSRKYALLFSILSLGALTAMSVAPNWFLRALLFNTALAFGGVALGYGCLGPRVFGKRNGYLATWSWLVFWPYYALNYFSLWLFRRTARESACDEIISKLWLGCRLRSGDAHRLPDNISVLDLTAEFSEVTFLRRVTHYFCVPVLDTTAPNPEDLKTGIRFLSEALEQGPVYVHCALGHGRSATFVAGYLISSEQVKSVEDALILLRAARPGVDLHVSQRALLDELFTNSHAL